MKWTKLRERYADFTRSATPEQRNRAVAIRAERGADRYKVLRERIGKDFSRLTKADIVSSKGSKRGVGRPRGVKVRRLVLRDDPNAPGEFNMGLGNSSFFFQSGGRR